MAADVEAAADRGRIARKEPGPCLVAKHHGAGVARSQAAPQYHRRGQHLEVVFGNQCRRERPALRRDEPRVLRNHAIEELPALPQRQIVAPAELLPSAIAAGPGDAMKGVRIAYGIGTEDVGIEHGERHGDQPESDGKREYRRRQKRRAVT
jgi:hypothetical protein